MSSLCTCASSGERVRLEQLKLMPSLDPGPTNRLTQSSGSLVSLSTCELYCLTQLVDPR
jgi:hypothetical protein